MTEYPIVEQSDSELYAEEKAHSLMKNLQLIDSALFLLLLILGLTFIFGLFVLLSLTCLIAMLAFLCGELSDEEDCKSLKNQETEIDIDTDE